MSTCGVTLRLRKHLRDVLLSAVLMVAEASPIPMLTMLRRGVGGTSTMFLEAATLTSHMY